MLSPTVTRNRRNRMWACSALRRHSARPHVRDPAARRAYPHGCRHLTSWEPVNLPSFFTQYEAAIGHPIVEVGECVSYPQHQQQPPPPRCTRRAAAAPRGHEWSGLQDGQSSGRRGRLRNGRKPTAHGALRPKATLRFVVVHAGSRRLVVNSSVFRRE